MARCGGPGTARKALVASLLLPALGCGSGASSAPNATTTSVASTGLMPLVRQFEFGTGPDGVIVVHCNHDNDHDFTVARYGLSNGAPNDIAHFLVPPSVDVFVCDLAGSRFGRRLLFNADFSQVIGSQTVAGLKGEEYHVVTVGADGAVVDYTAAAQRAGSPFSDNGRGMFDPRRPGHVFATGRGGPNRQSDHVLDMTADGSVTDLGTATQAASHGGFPWIYANLSAHPSPDASAAITRSGEHVAVLTSKGTTLAVSGSLPPYGCTDLIWLAGRRALCSTDQDRAAVLQFNVSGTVLTTLPFLPSVHDMSFPSAVPSEDGTSLAFIAYNRTDHLLLDTVRDPTSSDAAHLADLLPTVDPRDYFLLGWYGPVR